MARYLAAGGIALLVLVLGARFRPPTPAGNPSLTIPPTSPGGAIPSPPAGTPAPPPTPEPPPLPTGPSMVYSTPIQYSSEGTPVSPSLVAIPAAPETADELTRITGALGSGAPGSLDQAIRSLETLCEAQPEFVEAQGWLAVAHALAYQRAWIRRDPRVHHEAEARDRAAIAIGEAPMAGPPVGDQRIGNALGRSALGFLAWSQGQLAEARRQEIAIHVSKDHTPVFLLLACTTGPTGTGQAPLQAASSRGLPLDAGLIAIHSWWQLGKARTGNPAFHGTQALERAIETSMVVDRAPEPWLYAYEVARWMQRGPEELLGYLEEAKARDPGCPRVHALLADLWHSSVPIPGTSVDDWRRIAREHLADAVRTGPDHPAVLHGKAEFEMADGRHEAARDSAVEAAHQVPWDPLFVARATEYWQRFPPLVAAATSPTTGVASRAPTTAPAMAAPPVPAPLPAFLTGVPGAPDPRLVALSLGRQMEQAGRIPEAIAAYRKTQDLDVPAGWAHIQATRRLAVLAPPKGPLPKDRPAPSPRAASRPPPAGRPRSPTPPRRPAATPPSARPAGSR